MNFRKVMQFHGIMTIRIILRSRNDVVAVLGVQGVAVLGVRVVVVPDVADAAEDGALPVLAHVEVVVLVHAVFAVRGPVVSAVRAVWVVWAVWAVLVAAAAVADAAVALCRYLSRFHCLRTHRILILTWCLKTKRVDTELSISLPIFLGNEVLFSRGKQVDGRRYIKWTGEDRFGF
ncbi:hypothetical protein SAMN05444972_103216 [Marininema halotolerans]|uniref:Uncharacterized protein n=1 Tax=Marininema halotolerans TaxID=1155944 RepID=A0A1I6QKX6_9BACL|nr:hypothetical protein SAMN05444972_103216 [Marininema halotolerans]